MEKQGKREDMPIDSKEIQKNVQGQGQREQGQNAQDEFLDNRLDFNDMDEIVNQNEDKHKDIIIKWKEIRKKYIMDNPNLNEMDVTHGKSEGDFDKMLERIGNKTGKNKEQLRLEIRNYEYVV